MSVAAFCLNVLLFGCFNVISIMRYTLYPEIFVVMIKHPTQSLFLGAYSMGLSKCTSKPSDDVDSLTPNGFKAQLYVHAVPRRG